MPQLHISHSLVSLTKQIRKTLLTLAIILSRRKSPPLSFGFQTFSDRVLALEHPEENFLHASEKSPSSCRKSATALLPASPATPTQPGPERSGASPSHDRGLRKQVADVCNIRALPIITASDGSPVPPGDLLSNQREHQAQPIVGAGHDRDLPSRSRISSLQQRRPREFRSRRRDQPTSVRVSDPPTSAQFTSVQPPLTVAAHRAETTSAPNTNESVRGLYASGRVLCSRADNVSNFVKVDSLFGPDVRLVYKTYATLYFVFVFDNAENDLAMLDLMQVFVETLDKCFSNVCELDIVFNFKKLLDSLIMISMLVIPGAHLQFKSQVHTILDEIILGGQVLETSSSEVVKAVDEISRLESSSNSIISSIPGWQGR
ncbi:AP-3 complex subunit sigma [Striga asiatica]|uniref:AP-3 complex subunit sigma n=1 Tax=Striga asiatica TaxID=4170 RepID=A0A5A7QPR4_STRAF|nr:AP-3 complex subunit sigma [Striga asiatica]